MDGRSAEFPEFAKLTVTLQYKLNLLLRIPLMVLKDLQLPAEVEKISLILQCGGIEGSRYSHNVLTHNPCQTMILDRFISFDRCR